MSEYQQTVLEGIIEDVATDLYNRWVAAMPESEKFDGPAGIDTPGVQNKFAANSSKPLAKPGFGD